MSSQLSAADLGFRTDLIFHRCGGEVEQHDGFTVVRTPANPTFFWGNCLVFDAAPRAGDAQRWPALFDQHIRARQPAARHWAFGWRAGALGDIAPFIELGCTLEELAVMSATTVHPRAPRVSVALRALQGDDWPQLHALQMAAREPIHPIAEYAAFKERQIDQWRVMAEAGLGQWFGAFANSTLVAALGVYAEAQPIGGERLARYQHVVTHPDWQRQRLASALVKLAADYALTQLRADRLVMIAGAHDIAHRIYAAAGFSDVGVWRGLQKVGY